MPNYILIIKEKGRNGKTYPLPDSMYAPCAGEAWDLAKGVLPKDTTLIDVVREDTQKKKK